MVIVDDAETRPFWTLGQKGCRVYDMGRTKGRTLWSNYSCPHTDVMGIGCGLKS